MSEDGRSIALYRALLAAAVVMPAFLFAFVSWQNRQDVLREAEETATRTAAVLHEHARNVFETHALVLDRIDEHVRDLGWERIATAETDAYLARLNEPLDQVVSLWVTDASGTVRAGSRPYPRGISIADRDFFLAQRDRDAGLFVSIAFTGRATGVPSFAVSRRRTTADGRFDGIVHVAASPAYFARFFAEAGPSLRHATTLIRASGDILAREPERDIGTALRPDSNVMQAIAGAPEGGILWGRSPVDGRDRLYAYRPVTGFPLYVVFGLDTDDVLARWHRNVAAYGAVTVLASLVLFGTSWLALRRFRSERSALLALRREAEQRARAEEQLRQAQKLDAVGQLTGGLAHDFNNLLQVLSGCLQLVAARTSDTQAMGFIETGQQAVERGARLVGQLMAFARRQSLRPEVIDVRDRVLGMSELVTRALRADIALACDFEEGLWPVEVDPTQFELAVINLAVNARDAMPEGGRLRIAACNLPAAGRDPDLVRITVADTGTGMPPEVVSRVFEPFFTTKEVGKGTGLGLAQVYGFARQSGGRAEIESTPGRGTRVALLLPRATDELPAPPAARPPEPAATSGARVLLVEDDAMVGGIVAAALPGAGYAVIHAAHAGEALDVLRRGEPVDVLFSDVVMPGGTSGVSLADAARRLRPGLPVVLATGYSEDAVRAGDTPVLAKPYRIGALVEALEGALRRG